MRCGSRYQPRRKFAARSWMPSVKASWLPTRRPESSNPFSALQWIVLFQTMNRQLSTTVAMNDVTNGHESPGAPSQRDEEALLETALRDSDGLLRESLRED